MAKATESRILEAAVAEFAAHGYAGARVSRIAGASRTNKQLIYYYFGSKDGLYRRVMEGVHEEVLEAERSVPKDLEHDLLYWMEFHNERPYLLRLLEWDGLAGARGARGGRKARQMWRSSLARIDANQGVAGWPPGFHGAQTLIACLALATWPIAFPQVCRQITGLDPHDPRFIQDRRRFIGEFVRDLSSRKPRRPGRIQPQG